MAFQMKPCREVVTETDNILEMSNCTWQHKHYKQQLMASDGLEGLLYFIGDFNHYPSSLFSVGWRGTWKWGAHNSSKFQKSSIICKLNEWTPMAAWKLVSHKVQCAWFIVKQQKLALTLTWFFKHAKARVSSMPARLLISLSTPNTPLLWGYLSFSPKLDHYSVLFPHPWSKEHLLWKLI